MGTRWRTLYSGRGRARHHSGISARENRTGTERAKKARDPRRNGCLIETETARCIVWRTIYDTHRISRSRFSGFPRTKRVRFPIFHPKPLALQRNRWDSIFLGNSEGENPPSRLSTI